jgi:hypothetical protein
MPQPYQYTLPDWLHKLQEDAGQKGLGFKLQRRTVNFLAELYLQGVDPTIESIATWAEADPDRWLDGQELAAAHAIKLKRRPPQSEKRIVDQWVA